MPCHQSAETSSRKRPTNATSPRLGLERKVPCQGTFRVTQLVCDCRGKLTTDFGMGTTFSASPTRLAPAAPHTSLGDSGRGAFESTHPTCGQSDPGHSFRQ